MGSPAFAQKREALSYHQIAFLQLPTPVSDVAWKPDGTTLAVVSYPSISLWDFTSQKLSTLVVDAHVNIVSWSPDGSQLAAVQGGEDETLLIWDVSTGALVKRITRVEPYKAYIYRASWSPDGKKIASDGTGSYILIWDLMGDQKIFSLEGQDGRFGTPLWNADSSQVASSNNDGVHIWDVTSSKNIMTIQGAALDDWSSVDNRILGSGENGEVKVWDATTGQPLLTLNNGASVLSEKWNFNKNMIATGDINGLIKIWDAYSGKSLAVIDKHSESITGLAWHPAQNLLAAASFDGSLSIWQFDAR